MLLKGWLLAWAGKVAALDPITRGITAWKSTGTTQAVAFALSQLAKIYADLGRYDDACRTIGEALAAMETSGERWCEAEIQAKSWEVRAAMSMARLWRSQDKSRQARELLAPVYGWFTEGFHTLDLREAKTLLDELVG